MTELKWLKGEQRKRARKIIEDIEQEILKETYLFKIVRRTCEWLGHDKDDTTSKEIAEFVMMDLLDIE